MRGALITVIAGVCVLSIGESALPGRPGSLRERIEQIRLNKQGFEKVQNIHHNWFLHSIKAIMGQMGKELVAVIDKPTKRTFLRCLNVIMDKRDITSAAKCLVAARNSYLKTHKPEELPQDLRTKEFNGFLVEVESQNIQPSIATAPSHVSIANVNATRISMETPTTTTESAIRTSETSTTTTSSSEFTMSARIAKLRQIHLKKHKLLEKSSEGDYIKDKMLKLKMRGKSRINIRRPSMKEYTLTRLYGKARSDKILKNKKKTMKPMRRRKIIMEWKQAEKPRKITLKDILKKQYEKFRERSREQGFRRRFKRSPYRLITDKVSKSDNQKFTVKNRNKAPALIAQEKSPIVAMSNMIKLFVNGGNSTKNENRWGDSYKQLLKIQKAIDARSKEPGAKVYDHRMLDLVLGHEKPTRTKGEKSMIHPMIQEAYDLLNIMDGNKKAGGGGGTIKMLSPRFAPIMPDKADIRGKLSPSIFPFYKDDSEDQILPIPKMLEDAGMKEKDRESIMEMIMEVSQARETIDAAIKVVEDTNLFGMEGPLKDVTENMIRIFKSLEESFNNDQQKELKDRGFTFMETNQIEDLHDKQGIRHHDDMPFDIDEYRNTTREQRELSLWKRIERIAENRTEPEVIRRKRGGSLEVPSVLAPTVLAPFMFNPAIGLVVLGPVVLSPSVMSPLLLNPAVLSPYVLSPAVGIPFILSPYLLSPYVLSPLVMAPFILNPYVLSPNVINPYVLSPLILSPLVLCPDVISPMVLGGAILSPGVLSPSVLSKSYLMANVLSPTVLS